MRNLKRVLSLALACVMVIGMMVMGVSAADYGDYAEIDSKYAEAVDVMGLIKVIEGDDNGDFNPTDILTREQAAKIIAYMLLGKDNAEKLNANNTVFKDVAAGRWSAGYISYCTTMGILAGVGEGNFDPTGELTGVAFGKMLLCALGYDSKIEGYLGADWATNIATDIIGAGIDVKGVIMSEALTREQAAQMAYLTLQADMVDYDDRGWEMTLDNGQSIVMGASKATPVLTYFVNIAETDNYTGDTVTVKNGVPSYPTGYGRVQFCEKYFEDLTLTEQDYDNFGRPGHTWMNGKTGYFYQDTPVVTYTGKVTADTVAADLAGYKVNVVGEGPVKITNLLDFANATIKDLIDRTYVAGQDTALDLDFGSNAKYATIAEAISACTANGKVVEIYANKAKQVSDIVELEYTVAKLIQVNANKDKTEYKFSGNWSGIDYVNDNLDDTIEFHGTVNRGATVTLLMDHADNVLHVYPTTKFTGTQTAYTTAKNTIEVDGETYKVGVGVNTDGDATKIAVTDFGNSTKDADYYVDQFGYVVASNAIASNQYVYIVAADSTMTSTFDGNGIFTVKVRAVLADGTVGIYNLPVEQLKTGDRRIGTLVAGDWVVANTSIKVGAKGNNEGTFDNALNDTYLKGKIFGYTLSGDELRLESLSAWAANEVTNDQVINPVKNNVIKYTSGGNTILADAKTVFVVYDLVKGTTAVYTGTDSLPKAWDNDSYTGYVVGKANKDADEATASVVFITEGNAEVDSAYTYAYVSNVVTKVGLVNNKTVYTYNGVLPTGEVIELTWDNRIDCGNVYVYNADCEITDEMNTVVGSSVTAIGKVSDKGTLIKAGNTYYQLTNDSVVVYVDETQIKYDGKTCIVVMDVKANTATNYVDTIYVLDD